MRMRSLLSGEELPDTPENREWFASLNAETTPHDLAALIDDAEHNLADLRSAAEEMKRPVIVHQIVQQVAPQAEQPIQSPTPQTISAPFDFAIERNELGLARRVRVTSAGQPVGTMNAVRDELGNLKSLRLDPNP